jgi:hypothetical protein
MSNADAASEHARRAAVARWGDSVVRRAVGVVVERRDELAPDLLAELRAVASQDGASDD